MDISIFFAVGSFAVSERVLKPKVTILFVFACVLAYDLTTKTHDVSSLRVYRGPAMIAITLMMAALSLRTWRRNGVACDELLFLPGTPHGDVHGIESPPVVSAAPPQAAAAAQSPSNNIQRQQQQEITRSEEDDKIEPATLSEEKEKRSSNVSEMCNSLDSDDPFAGSSWDDEDNFSEDPDDNHSPPSTLLFRTQSQTDHNNSTEGSGTGSASPVLSNANDINNSNNTLQQWRENHPEITRIGSYFFFRSTALTTNNAAYSPSVPAVIGASLDLCMPISFNFHLFIEAYNHFEKHGGSEANAKILPIIFLSVLIVRSFIPPGRRGRFWSTLKLTVAAPFYSVRFRDCFVGDVMTSLVRPGQDILFALSYYVTVVWGTITGKYGLSESGTILESSWLLHNLILPSCAILPLWWKFLQTLRQAYDDNRRWPHYGNAFKYLTATLVILYAMTHKEDHRSLWWSFYFFLATLYQIFWDTIMDWGLLIIVPKQPGETLDDSENFFFCTKISSLRPNSYILLNLQMYVFQPVDDFVRKIKMKIPNWNQIQLRTKRLYKSKQFYYKIFAFNAVMRFTWMLCFIPTYHITDSRQEITFSSDVNSYVGVILPLTELLRRTLWGFLYLEKETIKMMDGDGNFIAYSQIENSDIDDSVDDDMVDNIFPLDSDDKSNSGRGLLQLPTWMITQQQLAHNAATVGSSYFRNHNNITNFLKSMLSELLKFKLSSEDLYQHLFHAELVAWSIIFVVLGCWASS